MSEGKTVAPSEAAPPTAALECLVDSDSVYDSKDENTLSVDDEVEATAVADPLDMEPNPASPVSKGLNANYEATGDSEISDEAISNTPPPLSNGSIKNNVSLPLRKASDTCIRASVEPVDRVENHTQKSQTHSPSPVCPTRSSRLLRSIISDPQKGRIADNRTPLYVNFIEHMADDSLKHFVSISRAATAEIRHEGPSYALLLASDLLRTSSWVLNLYNTLNIIPEDRSYYWSRLKEDLNRLKEMLTALEHYVRSTTFLQDLCEELRKDCEGLRKLLQKLDALLQEYKKTVQLPLLPGPDGHNVHLIWRTRRREDLCRQVGSCMEAMSRLYEDMLAAPTHRIQLALLEWRFGTMDDQGPLSAPEWPQLVRILESKGVSITTADRHQSFIEAWVNDAVAVSTEPTGVSIPISHPRIVPPSLGLSATESFSSSAHGMLPEGLGLSLNQSSKYPPPQGQQDVQVRRVLVSPRPSPLGLQPLPSQLQVKDSENKPSLMPASPLSSKANKTLDPTLDTWLKSMRNLESRYSKEVIKSESPSRCAIDPPALSTSTNKSPAPPVSDDDTYSDVESLATIKHAETSLREDKSLEPSFHLKSQEKRPIAGQVPFTNTLSGNGQRANGGEITDSEHGVEEVSCQRITPSRLSSSKRPNGLGREDEDDRRGEEPKRPRKEPITAMFGGRHRRLGCPYQKHDPIRNPVCGSPSARCLEGGFENIARLKQHLIRYHNLRVRCVSCWRVFPDAGARDRHHGALPPQCISREGPSCHWMSPDQKETLERRSTRNQSERDKWYTIFGMLLPGEALPINPYYNDFAGYLVTAPTATPAFQELTTQTAETSAADSTGREDPATRLPPTQHGRSDSAPYTDQAELCSSTVNHKTDSGYSSCSGQDLNSNPFRGPDSTPSTSRNDQFTATDPPQWSNEFWNNIYQPLDEPLELQNLNPDGYRQTAGHNQIGLDIAGKDATMPDLSTLPHKVLNGSVVEVRTTSVHSDPATAELWESSSSSLPMPQLGQTGGIEGHSNAEFDLSSYHAEFGSSSKDVDGVGEWPPEKLSNINMAIDSTEALVGEISGKIHDLGQSIMDLPLDIRLKINVIGQVAEIDKMMEMLRVAV